ncbi:DUF6596 domain-containing protein [Sorangium sp. So ce388]|uniref:DUF6596 domain-containing protein n=1 Tax=Sorangium sp. So ce388 TaxID=3133309 RepID=UPI003F5BFBF6
MSVRDAAAHALAALMCLHATRLPARVDASGNLSSLVHQDRSRWDQQLLAEGGRLLPFLFRRARRARAPPRPARGRGPALPGGAGARAQRDGATVLRAAPRRVRRGGSLTGAAVERTRAEMAGAAKKSTSAGPQAGASPAFDKVIVASRGVDGVEEPSASKRAFGSSGLKVKTPLC